VADCKASCSSSGSFYSQTIQPHIEENENMSEIEKITKELDKKQVTQIDVICNEIDETCERFVNLNSDLVSSGKELSAQMSEKKDSMSRVIKDFRVKSAGIQAAWRLNQEQFERGLERDAYERRTTELTQVTVSLKFDFDKCKPELSAFERQLLSTIQETKVYPIVEADASVIKSVLSTPQGITEKHIDDNSFGDPEAFIRIGLSYEQDKKPAKAKEFFESALVFRPNNATILFHLGRANSDLDNHTEAIKCLQKVLEINPHHTGALCDLGFSFGQIGNHKQASKCYEKLININANNSDAWVGLGTAQYSLGKLTLSKESLEKARQINPKNALVWYNLSLVYSSLGYQQESQRCYTEYERLSQ
jgi:tetratricopeptide (TPR) repeat protein